MEWLIAVVVSLAVLIWSGVYLIGKLARFLPPAKALSEQLKTLAEASARSPELTKMISALGDDPVEHVAARRKLQREARERKRQRERRLRDRDF